MDRQKINKLLVDVINEDAVSFKNYLSEVLYQKVNRRLQEEYKNISKTIFEMNSSTLTTGPEAQAIFTTSNQPQQSQETMGVSYTATTGAPLFVDGNGRPIKNPPPGAPRNPKDGEIWDPGKGPNFRWNQRRQRWEVVATPSRVPRSPSQRS